MKIPTLLLCCLMVAPSSADVPKCSSSDHEQWIAIAFQQMEAIHVGMKREELLKVFKPQAGFASVTRFEGTYVYKDSPYIRVEVEFSVADGMKDASGTERSDDIIKSISQPCLAPPVFD